jgi:hypothetical protein
VELFAARLGDNVDHRAGALAELRVIVAGLDTEFLGTLVISSRLLPPSNRKLSWLGNVPFTLAT